MSQVAAIDASNGQTIWTYDPETWKNGLPSNNGFVHQGITYWADGNDKRLILGTNTFILYELMNTAYLSIIPFLIIEGLTGMND